ncbi:MAG TPA: hypothetical protein VEJ68_02735 [Candidatus Bathyarchaeia archaeon]|nr:hypothetical protein [Candidatus Bathyarchaeia archaeon]
MKNDSLIKYFCSASKQSNQILAAVAAFVTEHKILSNWMTVGQDGWILPCTLDKYDWCGIWTTIGCLKNKLHEKLGKGRRNYIKQYQRSCYRPSCIHCYLKWIARQANRATRRIEEYAERTGQKPIHLMLMANKNQYDLPYKLLRKRMMEILKMAQWEGGAVIFHPFKFNENTRQFYYSPHFHLVGFGRKNKITRTFGMFGWYVKIGEERISVFQTFCYLLSHCGIRKRHHVVTWIGELSYSKVPSEKESKITCCPVCGGEFVPVYYEGEHPIVRPERHFEGLVDSDEHWKTVETGEWFDSEYCRFEYAPTRKLNEILQSLAEAN